MAKTKYVTVHTVHLTIAPGEARTYDKPGKPPKVKVLAPGTAIMLDKDDADALLATGAIQEAVEEVAENVELDDEPNESNSESGEVPVKKTPAKKTPVKKVTAKKATAKDDEADGLV